MPNRNKPEPQSGADQAQEMQNQIHEFLTGLGFTQMKPEDIKLEAMAIPGEVLAGFSQMTPGRIHAAFAETDDPNGGDGGEPEPEPVTGSDDLYRRIHQLACQKATWELSVGHVTCAMGLAKLLRKIEGKVAIDPAAYVNKG